MLCPRCQVENKAARRFCSACGNELPTTCPQCGFANDPLDQFCGGCGQALAASLAPPDLRETAPSSYTPKHLAEKILTSRATLEGERKRVTVLFCDLASSTTLAGRLGPEAMHTLLNRFFELSLAEVHRYEGTINQFLGDGFMALFGAPIAIEDHARRAVLSALGIQRSLAEQQGGVELPSGEELAVRMGLNTGLVVVGGIGDNLRMDYTAVGDTTNLAARLQELAEPGTILLSKASARLVRAYARVEALEPVEVKGKTEPVTAYRLLGLAPRRSPVVETLAGRALSPFVGRDREMATLHDLLAQAEMGQGQVVGLVGEAGAGKSRLLYEFRQSLEGRKVTFLEGHCLSYGNVIPYLPVVEILRDNCRTTEADDPEAIIEKFRFALREVEMDPAEGTPYLLNLLGVREGTEGLAVLSPEAIKARTFETLRLMSLKGGRKRPLILAVENLHWIDKTSEEYFTSLVESLAGAPILLIVTYRPGYRPPWIEKSYATQLGLRRLAPKESLTVVHSVVARETLTDPLAQLILAKAEGNPFFLEELTRVVAEDGGDRLELELPDTIHGVLMARIDRLPDAPKKLIQTASVLGREAPLGLLETIWEGPETLEPHLAELKRLEFLYERTEAEEPVYIFKHALTRDVAYESLLVSRRQVLHKAAGDALEALYADRLEEAYDRLSYHYSRASETEKAIDYLTRFAEKAARGYSHAESVTALQEATAHAQRLPDNRERDRIIIDLLLRQAQCSYFLGRFPESLELLIKHQEQLEQLQDPSMAGPYYFWLGHTYAQVGDQERAEQSAQLAIEEAERCGDEATLGKAHYLLSRVGWWLGRCRQGIEQGRQAVALLKRTKERWWQGQAHLCLGWIYWGMGEFESALETMGRIRAIGESIGDPRLQTYAAWNTGGIHTTMGEWETGIEYSKWALEHSADPLNTANALRLLGWAYLEKGDLAQAIPLLEEVVQQQQQFRLPDDESVSTTALGQAYLLSGQVDKAWDLAIQGLEIASGAGFQWGIGQAQRVLGQIARARGDLSEAELRLNEALDTFSSIEGRFEMGRTHLHLAELAHDRGNEEKTATHLKQAHEMFRALNVPNYVQRAEQLAKEYDITLPEGSAGAEM